MPGRVKPLSIVVVGSQHEPAFGSLIEWLEQLRQRSTGRAIVTEWLSSLPESSLANLIVVLRNWPDEFTPREVEQLFAAHPLARIICVDGPWCASAGRSHELWPVAVRVRLKEAKSRIEREIGVVRGVYQPLPVTASRDDTFRSDSHGIN